MQIRFAHRLMMLPLLHAMPLRLLEIMAQFLQPDVPIPGDFHMVQSSRRRARVSPICVCACCSDRPGCGKTRLRPSTRPQPDGVSPVQSSCGLLPAVSVGGACCQGNCCRPVSSSPSGCDPPWLPAALDLHGDEMWRRQILCLVFARRAGALDSLWCRCALTVCGIRVGRGSGG